MANQQNKAKAILRGMFIEFNTHNKKISSEQHVESSGENRKTKLRS